MAVCVYVCIAVLVVYLSVCLFISRRPSFSPSVRDCLYSHASVCLSMCTCACIPVCCLSDLVYWLYYVPVAQLDLWVPLRLIFLRLPKTTRVKVFFYAITINNFIYWTFLWNAGRCLKHLQIYLFSESTYIKVYTCIYMQCAYIYIYTQYVTIHIQHMSINMFTANTHVCFDIHLYSSVRLSVCLAICV